MRGKELMARITYAAQIDLRFGDPECEHLDVSAGVRPRDLTCKGLHLFKQRLVGLDGQTQTVAERIFCRAGTAVTGFWPGTTRAFARLALILRSVVKLHFFLWLASLRSLQIRVLGLLHAPT